MGSSKKWTERTANFLIAVIIVLSPTQLSAQTVIEESILAGYEGYAFPSADSHLIKPQQSATSTISLHCLKREFCDVIIPELKKYLKASWLKIEEVKKFDPSAAASVEIIYGYDFGDGDKPDQVTERINIEIGEKEEVYKQGSQNCVGYSIRKDVLVMRTVVIANLLGSKERYISCVMLGLAYGLGLKPTPTYDQAWTEAGGLGKATDPEFSQFMRGLGRVIALHTNTRWHSGETKEEFEQQLIGLTWMQLLGEE